MSTHTIRNGIDSWVTSNEPSQNKGRGKYLRVHTGTKRALLWFKRPVPHGSTVIADHIKLYGYGASGDTYTVNVQRVSEPWVESKVNWNNQPAVTGPVCSLTATQSVDGQEWSIDTTVIAQAWADGAPNYGVRISTTDDNDRRFYSLQSADNKPVEVISWADAPDAPTNLTPSGGSAVSLATPWLLYNYHDPNASELTSHRIQINASNTGWTADPSTGGFASPDFDTTELAADDPELDTSTTAWAGITAGDTVFWTVQVKNAAGKWSEWADPVSFTRVNKVTVTMDNPPAGDPVVEDPTPEFSWTVTGGSQVARRALVRKLSDPTVDLIDTGRIHTTETTFTPSTLLDDEDDTYEIELRTHDNDNRTATPNDQVYIQTVRQFTFREDPTPDPVTSLTATADADGLPAIQLDWERATFPDGYTIVRKAGDGHWKVIAHNLDPADLFQSGTASRYIDRTAFPNVDYTYKVRSRVNGKVGPGPTVEFTLRVRELWLIDVDTGRHVPLVFTDQDGQVVFAKPDNTGVLRPLGGSHVVRVTQGQFGPEGDVKADLVDYANHTAAHWLDNLMWMKIRPENKLRFILGSRNLHVTLSNLSDEPHPVGTADWRRVSFHFESYDGPAV